MPPIHCRRLNKAARRRADIRAMCRRHDASATPIATCDVMGSSFSSSASPAGNRRASVPGPSPPQAEDHGDQADADQTCFICLDAEGTLTRPCACPRLVHSHCMARWQLQQAGRREEHFCRFCHSQLKDWKIALTPTHLQPAEPIMVVTLGDAVHRITVKPGPDGLREFQQRIRTLFAIPDGTDFDVTFRCKAPGDPGRIPADSIQLEGMHSYEAATHCASLMAAQRIAAANANASTATAR